MFKAKAGTVASLVISLVVVAPRARAHPAGPRTLQRAEASRVDVKMVVYPRQPQGLREPKLALDAMQRNLDWFDMWLSK